MPHAYDTNPVYFNRERELLPLGKKRVQGSRNQTRHTDTLACFLLPCLRFLYTTIISYIVIMYVKKSIAQT